MTSIAPWRPTTRVAFRFCFTYLALYSLATQIIGSLILIPHVSFRGFGLLWPMREITFWVGRVILRIHTPLIYAGSSRDSDFYWVQAFWLLIVAIIATAVWSILDRKREHYHSLNTWFRCFVRFALAAQMFEYGMTKVIPTQFPSPSLNTLVTPLGNLSLQGMLWTSVGAATGYEIFTGCAELLAGILLIVPRTALLGALICLADMTQVFLLNMSYDIGVKMISFHLLLLTMFFLAPEVDRLAGFFIFDRAVEPVAKRATSRSRLALFAPILFGLYLLAMQADVNWVYWYAEGGGRAKSPLYGVWDVQQLSIDDQTRPAVLNDYDRQWRRVIFDTPDTIVFQRIDDSFARYGVSVDVPAKTMTLSKGQSRIWTSTFSFERQGPDDLVLTGEMDGYRIRMQLQLVGLDSFRLLNSDFRWVRPSE